jgi:hypothetical protein
VVRLATTKNTTLLENADNSLGVEPCSRESVAHAKLRLVVARSVLSAKGLATTWRALEWTMVSVRDVRTNVKGLACAARRGFAQNITIVVMRRKVVVLKALVPILRSWGEFAMRVKFDECGEELTQFPMTTSKVLTETRPNAQMLWESYLKRCNIAARACRSTPFNFSKRLLQKMADGAENFELGLRISSPLLLSCLTFSAKKSRFHPKNLSMISSLVFGRE